MYFIDSYLNTTLFIIIIIYINIYIHNFFSLISNNLFCGKVAFMKLFLLESLIFLLRHLDGSEERVSVSPSVF